MSKDKLKKTNKKKWTKKQIQVHQQVYNKFFTHKEEFLLEYSKEHYEELISDFEKNFPIKLHISRKKK